LDRIAGTVPLTVGGLLGRRGEVNFAMEPHGILSGYLDGATGVAAALQWVITVLSHWFA
jgi:hypothetical protein